MRLLINEAIKNYKLRTGVKVSKTYLATRLWPNTTPKHAAQNMSRLTTGKQKSVRLEWLEILSKELDCTKCQLIGEEPFIEQKELRNKDKRK